MTDQVDILLKLEELRRLLNTLHDSLNQSGVERTCGLRKILGEECPYYQKSLHLYIDNDFNELRNLVEQVHNLYLSVEEGINNG